MQLPAFPNLCLSHFELYVDDIKKMEIFYAQCLGFVATDRGEGVDGMVFMSRKPAEHHQLVLTPVQTRNSMKSPLDHIAFRVDSISDLRVFHQALVFASSAVQTVSHGTSWSVYFQDPEDNRLEVFSDTPWHVDQPCRFEIDFNLSDEKLIEFTKNTIQTLPGFKPVSDWKKSHVDSVSMNVSED